MISTMLNVHLINWSFNDGNLIATTNYFNGRKTYFIYFLAGTNMAPYNFFLDVKVNKNNIYSQTCFYINLHCSLQNYNSSSISLDIAIVGHYVHHEEIYTNEFKQFLANFPSWAHVQHQLGSYESWIF